MNSEQRQTEADLLNSGYLWSYLNAEVSENISLSENI